MNPRESASGRAKRGTPCGCPLDPTCLLPEPCLASIASQDRVQRMLQALQICLNTWQEVAASAVLQAQPHRSGAPDHGRH